MYFANDCLMSEILTPFFCADQEIIDTFDRAEYRQPGSSLDSNNQQKKKKNNKMFKGFGMFK